MNHLDGVTSARQFSCCYWFTGLPGAGKSTLSRCFGEALRNRGHTLLVLDADHLRTGLNRDLGFSRADRTENVRRIGEVARLLVDAGQIVLVAAISPYREDRDAVRSRFAAGRFVEVFVDTDLATCMARDPKGLYRKARGGELVGLTGWDDPYERPQEADLVVATTRASQEAATEMLVQHYLSMEHGQ